MTGVAPIFLQMMRARFGSRSSALNSRFFIAQFIGSIEWNR